MENQHRKISGYRELSQTEIHLINRIKAKGVELLELQAELVDLLKLHELHELAKINAVDGAQTSDAEVEAKAEFNRFHAAEPFRWAAIGKTDIQTGIMAMVRAVAQPAGV